jgi:hypothetical protein
VGQCLLQSAVPEKKGADNGLPMGSTKRHEIAGDFPTDAREMSDNGNGKCLFWQLAEAAHLSKEGLLSGKLEGHHPVRMHMR